MRKRILALVLALAVVAGCGGGGSKDAADGDGGSTTTSRPVGDDTRPSGRWAVITVLTERSDTTEVQAGEARMRLADLEPTCEAGPCDVDVTPGGENGTYLPPGVTPAEGASDPKPYTLEWDAAEESYHRRTDDVSDCTTADGTVVADGYDVVTETVLEFRAAGDARPATMHGTYEQSVSPTAAGKAAPGCTAFVEKGFVAAAPSDAADELADVDLAGTYTVTETVKQVEPAGQRDPGVVGLLPEQTIAGNGPYTITGVLDAPAPLERAGKAFGGTSGPREAPCRLEPVTPKGFTSTETWRELTPVALTTDGQPILAAQWRLFENPTPAGVAAGCSLSTNEGHLVLVPSGSLP